MVFDFSFLVLCMRSKSKLRCEGMPFHRNGMAIPRYSEGIFCFCSFLQVLTTVHQLTGRWARISWTCLGLGEECVHTISCFGPLVFDQLGFRFCFDCHWIHTG